MRIYAIADIHGREIRLNTIQDAILKFRPDVCIVAGDIINYFQPKPTLSKLNEMGVPVWVIRGNTDPWYLNQYVDTNTYPRLYSIHLRPREWNGIRFIGVDGTLPVPFRSRVCLREARLLQELVPLVTSGSVLVVHPPPLGILDKVAGKWSAGSSNLRSLIEKARPQVCICGHIHESAGFEWIGHTCVVNCSIGKNGCGAIIDLNGTGTVEVKMI